MKKNSTAIILTIVSIVLWVLFALRWIVLPESSFLVGNIDSWLLAFIAILTSVTVALWLATLVRRWHGMGRVAAWILYGTMSLFWLFFVFGYGSLVLSLFSARYVCSNDKDYVMHSNFDGTFFVTSLYKKQGILEVPVCFLDYYNPFEDPKLFVYNELDAVVVQIVECDSTRKDVYHLDKKGTIYNNSDRESILAVIDGIEGK